MKPIPINLDDLATALFQCDPYSEASWFLDLRSGEFVFCGPDFADDFDEDPSERSDLFRYIEPDQDSKEGYRDMEDFVSTLPEGETSRALARALKMRKPFANFRHQLHDFLDVREQWFNFERRRQRLRAKDYLDQHEIAWTDVSPPLDPEPEVVASESPPFQLHPRLEKGGLPLGSLLGCRVLLKNNALFPWVILVPEVAEGTEDLHQLDPERYREVTEAIRVVSQFVSDHFQPDKLNVACIGNQVRQMHIHLVGRSPDDPAWPGTVWAHEGKQAYDAEAITAIQKAWAAARE